MRIVLRSVIGACVFSLLAASSAGAGIAKKKSDVKAEAGKKNGKAEPAKKDSKVAALTRQDPKAAPGGKTAAKSKPATETKKDPKAKPASAKDAKGKAADAKKNGQSKSSDKKDAKNKASDAKKGAKAKPAASKDAKSKPAKSGKIKTAEAKKKKKRTKVRIWKDARPAMAGLASVYRYKKPRRGASGEVVNGGSLIAAHRNLRFGTKVRVTNRRNGKSVIVRIIDRGPFIRGRVIDLSPAAARKIGLGWGLAPVTLAVVGARA